MITSDKIVIGSRDCSCDIAALSNLSGAEVSPVLAPQHSKDRLAAYSKLQADFSEMMAAGFISECVSYLIEAEAATRR